MTRRRFLSTGIGVTAMVAVGGENVVRAEPSTAPGRVFDGHRLTELPWGDLSTRLSLANVVFLGEQHDDPRTHVAEAAVLSGLFPLLGDRLTLGMEMFERDQQGPLDEYLAGRIDEAEMKKRIKVWSNYPTDYRPMVEFARQNHIPVVATNAPARIVRAVGKEGLSAVTGEHTVSEDRGLIAASIQPPIAESDEYNKRFAGVIGAGHGDGKGMDTAMVRRFFEAQCVRDDTMAESIARLLDQGRTVLHVNGCFHSDAGLGTVQRLLWRRPLLARPVVVKIVPYKGELNPASAKGEGDYLIFVPDLRPAEKEG